MNEISRWMNSGAEVQEGLRLLSVYAPNPHLDKLVTANPARFKYLLVRSLSKYADIRIELEPAPKKRTGKFREQWAFLSEPSCPPELKILASDSITTYHSYCELHENLFDCTTTKECFETAKNLLKNFRQNRIIFSEFAFYREHHSILGKHPIFKESERMKSYQAMTDFELFESARRLKGAIWRIESEIKKGDRPHLLSERESRLARKRAELESVQRMIAEIEKRRR